MPAKGSEGSSAKPTRAQTQDRAGRQKPIPVDLGVGKAVSSIQSAAKTLASPSGQQKLRAQQKARQDFVRRRAAALKDVQVRVAKGGISPIQGHAQLQQMGFVPGGVGFGPPSGPGHFLASVIGNIVEDTAYTPAGLYELGKAPTLDVLQGDSTFPHTREIAKQLAVGTYETARHPLRRPGDTALLGLAALSAGAGTVSRVSAAASAARTAGEESGALRAALLRPKAQGGSLLRKPPPGTMTVKVGGETIQRLEPDNALLRPVARARNRRLQRQLDAGREQPDWLSNQLYDGLSHDVRQFSPEHLAGREVRASRRVRQVLSRPLAQIAVKATRDFTQPEKDALRVVAIEGSQALEQPAEVIARQVATHVKAADEAQAQLDALLGSETPNPAQVERLKGQVILNRLIAEDLPAAEAVLENPSPRFLAGLHATRRLSREMTQRAVKERLLTQEAATNSRATVAAAYGRDVGETPGAPLTPGLRAATIRQERLQKAVAQAEERVAKGRFTAEQRRKIAQIQVAHGEDPNALFGEASTSAAPLQRGKIVTADGRIFHPIGTERLNTLTAALSQATEELQRLQSAAKTRYARVPAHLKPNVSASGVPPKGSFYFPTGAKFVEDRLKQPVNQYQPRIGEQGVPRPDVNRAMSGTLKQRSGNAAFTQGVVDDITKALTDLHSSRERLYEARAYHRSLLRMSTATRMTDRQVPIRSIRGTSETLRKVLAAEQKGKAGLETAGVRRYLDTMLVKASDAEAQPIKYQIGEQIPGVRWVDERLLKDVAVPGAQLSKVLKVASAVNYLPRLFGVYLRPAYLLTNLPQNVILQTVQQGLRVGPNLARAVASRHLYGERLTRSMEDAMGTAKTESFRIEGEKGLTKRLVGGITRVTDRDARVSAFLFRAAEQGYVGKRGLARLFRDREAVTAVARRARRDSYDFDSLTPAERELSEFIYFYPFISRSAATGVRAYANRPIKMAAITQAANIARKKQEDSLGLLPAWAYGYLVTKAGLSNLNPVNVFPEPVGTLQQLGSGDTSFAEALGTPFLGLAAAPLKTSGSPSQRAAQLPGAFLSAIGQSIVQPTAEATFLRRAGIDIPGVPEGVQQDLIGKPSKSFPATGIGTALGSAVFGGPFPRKPDYAELNRQGRSERNRPDQNLIEDSKKVGLPPPPPQVLKGLEVQHALDSATHNAQGKTQFHAVEKVYEQYTGDTSFRNAAIDTDAHAKAYTSQLKARLHVLTAPYNAWESQVQARENLQKR